MQKVKTVQLAPYTAQQQTVNKVWVYQECCGLGPMATTTLGKVQTKRANLYKHSKGKAFSKAFVSAAFFLFFLRLQEMLTPCTKGWSNTLFVYCLGSVFIVLKMKRSSFFGEISCLERGWLWLESSVASWRKILGWRGSASITWKEGAAVFVSCADPCWPLVQNGKPWIWPKIACSWSGLSFKLVFNFWMPFRVWIYAGLQRKLVGMVE